MGELLPKVTKMPAFISPGWKFKPTKKTNKKSNNPISLFSIYILNKMGMQKRQFFYASNYHLLVCKDGKLRREMILENNLLKFYGLGCQKCNGSLILYG